MAIYAPKTQGRADQVQVASLVKANAAASPSNELTSLTIDGQDYGMAASRLAGRDGDVPYLGRTAAGSGGYVPETILRQDIYVCEDQDDYDKSLGATTTMKEVFESWIKGGNITKTDKWYGYDADYAGEDDLVTFPKWLQRNRDDTTADYQPQQLSQLQSDTLAQIQGWRWPGSKIGTSYGFPCWFYNQSTQAIVQACNTADHSFYLSPTEMTAFDVTVRCRGYDTDDDFVGLVAAASPVDGASGRPRYMAFLRSPNNQNTEYAWPYSHWFCAIDTATGFAKGQFPADFELPYGEPRLSAAFLPKAKGSHQYRFTARDDWSDDDGRPTMKPGKTDRLSPDSYNYSSTSPWWNAHPLPYETLCCNRLYQWDGSSGHTTTKIKLNNLSAPANWWWLSDSQFDAYKDRFSKTVGWGNFGHVYIRVKRSGSKLSAWTTRFTGSPPEGISAAAPNGFGLTGDFGGLQDCPGTTDAKWNAAVTAGNAFRLDVNLESTDTIRGIQIKENFGRAARPNGGRIGFITLSQSGATWDIIDMKIPKLLVKTWSNELVQYNPLDKTETVLPDLPVEYCGRGRLCKNCATGKTFYVGDQGFLKVVDPAPEVETWKFTVQDGSTTRTVTKKIVVKG